jgi:hypothetical protein
MTQIILIAVLMATCAAPAYAASTVQRDAPTTCQMARSCGSVAAAIKTVRPA